MSTVKTKVENREFRAQDVIEATPGELLDNQKYRSDALREALGMLRNQINSLPNNSKRRRLEEQYCYVARELETRN